MSGEKDWYSIVDALASMFESYGAHTAPSNTDPQYLRVICEDKRIAVGFSISNDLVTVSTLRSFLAQTSDSFFNIHVFVSNHPYSDDVRYFAGEYNVILLDRRDLEIELGKSHLMNIELFQHPMVRVGIIEDRDRLIRQDLHTLDPSHEHLPELITVLEKYRQKNTPKPVFILDENRGIHEPSPGSMEKDMTEKTMQVQPPQTTSRSAIDPELKGPIIKPKIHQTDLPPLCGQVGSISTAQMELIPYFLYAFVCSVHMEGSNNIKESSGLIAVNGVTLDIEEWELGFNTINELKMDYVRLVPRTDEKVAYELAYNGVVQTNTKVLKVTTESNGKAQTRARKTFPDTSSLKLKYQGIYYFPHWHLIGTLGSMFLDAVNGDVVSVQDQ